jgi:putative two-component system response regulator
MMKKNDFDIKKAADTQTKTSGRQRMNAYAQMLARDLGWGVGKCKILKFAVLFHDIGKIGIPDAILNKPGLLTKKEWKVMKEHPAVGAQIVAPTIHGPLIAPIIRAHHENWDGTGYPDGLEGEEIPEEARLIAVVNAFDVMTTKHPYREALAPNDAYLELTNNSGSQFDPRMVEAFCRCWDRGEIQAILEGEHYPQIRTE